MDGWSDNGVLDSLDNALPSLPIATEAAEVSRSTNAYAEKRKHNVYTSRKSTGVVCNTDAAPLVLVSDGEMQVLSTVVDLINFSLFV